MTRPTSAAIQRLEKRANPVLRLALQLGVAPKPFALLETTGRRSGLPRLTPIGGGLNGDTFWLVAGRGRQTDYVKNLLADPRVRVKARGRWYEGTAAIVPDDDGLTRRAAIDRANGWMGRADGVFFRATASSPLSVRIDLVRR